MEFILGLIAGLVIGFIWGVWKSTQSFIERIIERPEEIREIMDRVKKINDESQTETKEEVQSSTNNVRAEFHQGVCYLYDHNDKFLAQGATPSDAIDAAKKRFPDMKFYFRVNIPEESNQ